MKRIIHELYRRKNIISVYICIGLNATIKIYYIHWVCRLRIEGIYMI
jgi:hypothetical protein